jgi:hypothetical protein
MPTHASAIAICSKRIQKVSRQNHSNNNDSTVSYVESSTHSILYDTQCNISKRTIGHDHGFSVCLFACLFVLFLALTQVGVKGNLGGVPLVFKKNRSLTPALNKVVLK